MGIAATPADVHSGAGEACRDREQDSALILESSAGLCFIARVTRGACRLLSEVFCLRGAGVLMTQKL